MSILEAWADFAWAFRWRRELHRSFASWLSAALEHAGPRMTIKLWEGAVVSRLKPGKKKSKLRSIARLGGWFKGPGRRFIGRPGNDSLDRIFHKWNTTYGMGVTEVFEVWWNDLSADEHAEIDAKVGILEEHGPTLSRPHADRIESSRHSNMTELRGKVDERHLRVLFAFDPRRTALLLPGGDKTDDPAWCDKFVPIADDLFDQHLKEIEHQQPEKK